MLWLRILNPAKDKIDDALIVRGTVYNKQERLSHGADEDEYDYYHSTRHPVVYDDSKPVATNRLLFGNEQIAHTRSRHYGIALEDLLDLSPLKEVGLAVVEFGRLAALEEYRRSKAIRLLLAGAYWTSRDTNADLWVAAANAESDVLEDALLMARVASARRLDSPLRVGARTPSSPPANPSKTFYTPMHWALAQQGYLSALPLPQLLTMYVEKFGALVMGEPLYIHEFSRWTLPISAWLKRIPARTLAQFNALEKSRRSLGQAPRRAA
ncbi:GNAT family N-acyltransferase [Hyalangium versicolor]|uniref:GNAT family N-acyltransferase n=1 Tax=Hyalangium versicolor TaxID=2861190 RepID=UPI001CCC74C0|nr:GNAT family N-acyltransferase [Hyalangium versicolor]